MNEHAQAIDDALEVLNPESLLYIRLNEAKQAILKLEADAKANNELAVYPPGTLVTIGSSRVGEVTVRVEFPEDVSTALGNVDEEDEDEDTLHTPRKKEHRSIDPETTKSGGRWRSAQSRRRFVTNLRKVEYSDLSGEEYTKGLSRCYEPGCATANPGRYLDLGNGTWYHCSSESVRWQWKETLAHAVERHGFKPDLSFITFINRIAKELAE